MIYFIYFRGKTNTTDNLFVTSVVFNSIGGHTFLYALYRDDHIRMWSTKTGQCVSVVNCLQDGKDARPQGRKLIIGIAFLYKI